MVDRQGMVIQIPRSRRAICFLFGSRKADSSHQNPAFGMKNLCQITRSPDHPITRFFLLSCAELAAKLAEAFLIFRAEASHDLGNASGMAGENTGNHPASRGRDGGENEAFV